MRAALEWMWPVLTPAQLLHDLFGSSALLRLAGTGILSEAELATLERPRAADIDDVRWTASDVALLDDAREVLGPRARRNGKVDPGDEIRTYGQIVVDEVQDLTPMELKMATRRSLNGSMTVVGDLAQATGPVAPTRWEDVLAHLPDRQPARVVGLSVGYRIPAQIMELADRVMRAAAPDLRTPRAVRLGDAAPVIEQVRPGGDLLEAVADATAKLAAELSTGNVAVVVPDDLADDVSMALVPGRHRARPGQPHRPGRRRHGRAGQRRQGPRAGRRGRRGAGAHRRRTRRAAGAVRRAHPPDPAPRRRPRRAPPPIHDLTHPRVCVHPRVS